MKKCRILLMLSFIACLHVSAQEVNKTLQEGNEFYKQQQYDKADITYKRVLELDRTNTTAKFNRATTMVRQNRQGEAMKELDELAAYSTDADLKSKSYYNKGVVLSGQKRLEESIEAYKNALRQNPNDQEARENLQKALTELKKKAPPPPPKKDNKKKNEKQQQKQQQKMNEKEAEQRLKLLEQKEKNLQQRLQKQKSSTSGGGQPKDW